MEALEVTREELGDRHPAHTLNTITNLAVLYWSQGKISTFLYAMLDKADMVILLPRLASVLAFIGAILYLCYSNIIRKILALQYV